jgi:hypothetical protein
MMKLRLRYLILIALIIVLGLLSWKFSFIPLWIGDVLWATMVWFVVRFLLVKSTVKRITLISLVFCYAIEFSQLYKAPWIDSLRHTLFGRLVLGDTFLWGDLLSYTAGVLIAILIDMKFYKNRVPGR